MRKVVMYLVIAFSTLSMTAETYLAHNVWMEKPEALFACNYKRGTMIPAGTEVSQIGKKIDRRNRTYLYFEIPEYGNKGFCVYIQDSYQGDDFTLDQLQEQMFTTKTFDEMTNGFSESVVEAIERGDIVKGMPKEAVLVSWGYPPHATTFSTALNTWLYYMNRWKKHEIIFDKEGNAIGDAQTN